MDLDLLKYLTEGGAIALSVAANVGLVLWLKKIQSRNDTLNDKLFDTVKECAEAMTEARMSTVSQSEEINRSVSMLSQIIQQMQLKGH